MDQILRIATSVGTPLALIGLVSALCFYAYSRKVKRDEKQLELLPEKDRLKLLEKLPGVTGKKISPEQQFTLLQDAAEKRYRLTRFLATISSVLFVICLITATVAYLIVNSRSRETVVGNKAFNPDENTTKQHTPSFQTERAELGETVRKISECDKQLSSLTGSEKIAKDLKDLEPEYLKAKMSIFDTAPAEVVKAKSLGLLSRVRELEISEEEKKLVATIEEDATNALFFPEEVYTKVKQLCERVEARRARLEADLKQLRDRELQLRRLIQ